MSALGFTFFLPFIIFSHNTITLHILLHIQFAHMIRCSRSLVSRVQCDVEKLPHAVVHRVLSRGKCRDSCGYYSIQSAGHGTVRVFPVSKIGAPCWYASQSGPSSSSGKSTLTKSRKSVVQIPAWAQIFS